MEDFKLLPVGRRIIVKPADKENKTSFGLVIPDTASNESPNKGVVVAVGPMVGRDDEDCCGGCCGEEACENPEECENCEDLIKVGSTILFSKYSPTEIEFEGIKYLIISEADVMAVIK